MAVLEPPCGFLDENVHAQQRSLQNLVPDLPCRFEWSAAELFAEFPAGNSPCDNAAAQYRVLDKAAHVCRIWEQLGMSMLASAAPQPCG
ncbi:hypothetical protein M1D34_25515 (plasmid) [Ensifer sp. D2-11]